MRGIAKVLVDVNLIGMPRETWLAPTNPNRHLVTIEFGGNTATIELQPSEKLTTITPRREDPRYQALNQFAAVGRAIRGPLSKD